MQTQNNYRACGERGCSKRAITPGGWCYAHDRLYPGPMDPAPGTLLLAGILLGLLLAGALLTLISLAG